MLHFLLNILEKTLLARKLSTNNLCYHTICVFLRATKKKHTQMSESANTGPLFDFFKFYGGFPATTRKKIAHL